jgi:uncharacterized protein YceK
MKGTLIAVFVTIAAVLLSGCGTICNLATGDPEIYGGPQKDAEFLQNLHPAEGGGAAAGKGMAIVLLATVADVSLSVVGDTLTLPLAIYMRQHDHTDDDMNDPVVGTASPAAPPSP